MVSLLVLAEHEGGSPRKEDVEALARWALQCARVTEGGTPRLKMEMLSFVLGTEQDINMMDEWVAAELDAAQGTDRATEYALFDFEFATFQRPHAISSFQAYDSLSRLARGSVLLLLRSGQASDSVGCDRLHAAMGTLKAYPRLAVLGFHQDPVQGAVASLEEAVKGNPALEAVTGKTVEAPAAPAVGVPFTYTGHVSGVPLLIRTSALEAIGGIDPVHVLGADGPALSAWMLCTRIWLAGFQVGMVQEEFSPFKVEGKQSVLVQGAAYPETIDASQAPGGKVTSLLDHYAEVSKAVKEAS